MGFNIGLSAVTASSLFITCILLVIMGVLLTAAADKMTQIPEFGQFARLQNNYNQLKTAYILVFVAAGIVLLLGIIYAGQGTYWNPSEWIHMFFFVIVLVLLIIALLYAYAALNSIYNPDLVNLNGTNAYLWASLLFGVISGIFVLMIAGGRIGYNMISRKISNQWNQLKDNLSETGYDVAERLENVVDNLNTPGFDLSGELNDIASKLRQNLTNETVTTVSTPPLPARDIRRPAAVPYRPPPLPVGRDYTTDVTDYTETTETVVPRASRFNNQLPVVKSTTSSRPAQFF